MVTLAKRVARRLGFDLQPDERSEIGRAKFVEEMIPKQGVGAEIGVHKGYFTPLLLEITRPQELHIIDPWYLIGEEWSWGAGNRSTIDALTRVIRHLKEPLVAGVVKLHIADDLEILPTFPKRYFDWLYFDTSHNYEHTLNELEISECLIKDGGVICGDDWRTDPSHPHYGVKQAVDEFCTRRPFSIVYEGALDRQWAIRRSA